MKQINNLVIHKYITTSSILHRTLAAEKLCKKKRIQIIIIIIIIIKYELCINIEKLKTKNI